MPAAIKYFAAISRHLACNSKQWQFFGTFVRSFVTIYSWMRSAVLLRLGVGETTLCPRTDLSNSSRGLHFAKLDSAPSPVARNDTHVRSIHISPCLDPHSSLSAVHYPPSVVSFASDPYSVDASDAFFRTRDLGGFDGNNGPYRSMREEIE
jgi:hypothetical protein